jgi:hypothetical protein
VSRCARYVRSITIPWSAVAAALAVSLAVAVAGCGSTGVYVVPTAAPPVTSSPAGGATAGPTDVDELDVGGMSGPVVVASSTTVAEESFVIAWQPSHQDDTGYDDWHEYLICKDIVDRTIALAPRFRHVIAWETGMGLTGTNNRGGTNRDAFDSELRIANEAGADCFISIHNDGSSVSGVMGMYFSGDSASAQVADALAEAIAEGLGFRHRATVGRDLYSLDPVRNNSPIRVLLEIGDNLRDRALLEDPQGRARIASLLAAALSSVPEGTATTR